VNRALLDTDIYSDVLKAVDPTVVRNASEYRRFHGSLTISVVTVMEIVSGLQRVRREHRIQTFLNAIARERVVLFDQDAAELAGRITGDLVRTGQPIGLADPMIAAIALKGNLELVSANTTHYERIEQLGYALILQNWRA